MGKKYNKMSINALREEQRKIQEAINDHSKNLDPEDYEVLSCEYNNALETKFSIKKKISIEVEIGIADIIVGDHIDSDRETLFLQDLDVGHYAKVSVTGGGVHLNDFLSEALTISFADIDMVDIDSWLGIDLKGPIVKFVECVNHCAKSSEKPVSVWIDALQG